MTSPIGDSTLGKSETARPTMWRTRVAVVSSEVRAVITCRPSRKTVARSHSSKTSSSRWLTNSTATPRSRVWRTMAKSRSTSWAESDAVGSSRTSTRASNESALAISISCWSAIERPRTSAPGSIRTPRPGEDGRGRAAHRAPVHRREAAAGRVAHEDVLGDGQVREEARLLVDDGDAQRSGVGGPVQLRRRPVEEDRAGVGLVDAGQDLDQRALAGAVLADERVDLAGSSSSETLSSACVAAKRFETPLSATPGCGSGSGRGTGRGRHRDRALPRGLARPADVVPPASGADVDAPIGRASTICRRRASSATTAVS